LNQIFWRNRKVLITGHTGFKGGWLSLWLQHLGADVVGVSLDPPTTISMYEQADVKKRMTSLRQDIRDGEAIKKLFQQHKPEIVFHLAAQPLVRYSYREPVETYETNVMGTLHILEGIRSIDSVRSAVMITTDKCYQNKEWVWGYRETDALGGHDPYSSSKGAAELLISSYRDSIFHKTNIVNIKQLLHQFELVMLLVAVIGQMTDLFQILFEPLKIMKKLLFVIQSQPDHGSMC